MNPTLEMIISIFERAALLLIILFFLTKIKGFKEILQKKHHSVRELSVLTIVFCSFAIFGTYSGIEVEGSLVNIRTVAIISGGILFGPWVGIITGIVSGLHRYLIDIDGITSLPCLITSITAGFASGFINKRIKKHRWWYVGILTGVLCQALTMTLIITLSEPRLLGISIVEQIVIPMMVGEVSIGLLVLLVHNIEGEKKQIAAAQAKLALDIANKTLPYFRSITPASLQRICQIIKEEIGADAVAITDTETVIAYHGLGAERYQNTSRIVTDMTKEALSSGEIVIRNEADDLHLPQMHCLLIVPFQEGNEVTGALKIYYEKKNRITDSLQTLGIGLAQIISNLMEISRIEQIKEAANKAELKALQSKINPHFLFNSLNAIASTTRRDPNRARELIHNLSGYLRYNLELHDEMIAIEEELKQVRDYVEIEKSRFGDKLHIVYDIDPVQVKVPSLLLQPLVENAIHHGVRKSRWQGAVYLSVTAQKDFIRISVSDTGAGIEKEIVEKLYKDEASVKNIGLANVHQRVRLNYGKGLTINRLDPGTEIYFDIPVKEGK
ncbi:two-component system, LytT family, sensor kinase [Terribacillus aidingensis]|uniref:histidine kinase n=1 Tax=Terribacillus aidingensis TaxID=586416 RepID=A0A285MZW5_9BACI|nr:LytS/YhcK type 5TM receptor domain-containing protein [Terribacillus aidingensis]SNZ02730.1 two-component system, LytT family, sensor kinase [Terribacillus aidingensis]